ncbi:Bin3-domain-containing protein [Calocera viscosa TUFC12733]|uniref:RNA methyltransferase n=1 Tax=Calocera viscosa (strain TUFC12733) TaxID=1330018 RepID=A0A167KUZ6_CALVF|nr:Bin3-domain-containing protein [Calocera viscosa TUFC12733]
MERNHTPLHGNYHGYYKRPPISSDPRLALFPRSFFRHKRVLDVGCNEGYVTCELAQDWGAREVKGVDVDRELVRLAEGRMRMLWSLEQPALHTAPSHSLPEPPDSESAAPQPTNGGSPDTSHRADYFPQCMPHIFGPLPLPPAPPSQPPQTFPYNITFQALDWARASLSPSDSGKWDVILLFSVVKWIHLNTGDAGLIACFHKAHAALVPGGKLVLELQEWAGYRQAVRGDQRRREKYRAIQLRPEGYERVLLEEIGFDRCEHLLAGRGERVRRPIDVYHKA